ARPCLVSNSARSSDSVRSSDLSSSPFDRVSAYQSTPNSSRPTRTQNPILYSRGQEPMLLKSSSLSDILRLLTTRLLLRWRQAARHRQALLRRRAPPPARAR